MEPEREKGVNLSIPLKKRYKSPKLTVFGNVERITQARGAGAADGARSHI